MPIDPRRIIRIRATVNSAISGRPTATRVLIDLYTTSREQMLAMLDDEDLRAEFVSLLPALTERPAARGDFGQILPSVPSLSAARLRLQTLIGWLDGLIESLRYDAQIAANAEAYAAEKVKAERGLGFKPE